MLALALAGCYGAARATRDVNEAWRGRPRAALEARWGAPASVEARGDGAVLRWVIHHRHVELPSASGALEVSLDPLDASFDASLEVTPGRVHRSTTEVVAEIDPAGVIARVDGPSLRWGAPRGLNLRWGVILGLHAGMSRLDDTGTALPGGGVYLGGMLGPRLGLVGVYELASGSDDAGGAMGMAWGIAAQWWPAARVALRLGPAMVLDFDPGFEDATLGPGVTGAASVAVIRAGAFVLDLRVDVTAAPGVAFGGVGVGVHAN